MDGVSQVANLKIFVSSTCYDMHAIRAQLRTMLLNAGYEPVMSDQADVIYDPRIHTHTSCLREVENCDAAIVVVGSRFGGTTVPRALELVDLDRIGDISRADRFGEDKAKISITQAEVLKSIQSGIPVFAFVETGVMRDHLTYEKNKNKSIIGEIEFSSIDKSDTAPYIFEFINFLRLRNENNSIFEFSRFEDIESQLKKQWSGLFQRLLHEQRTKSMESRRIDNLSSQIADLKAAVLGSISSVELKETAKGALRFRQLIEFTRGIMRHRSPEDLRELIKANSTWTSATKSLGVKEFRSLSSNGRAGLPGFIVVMDDQTYFKARLPIRYIERFSEEWSALASLSTDALEAILTAVIDSLDVRVLPMVRHYNEPYQEDVEPLSDEEDSGHNSTPATILVTQEKFIEESLKIFLTSHREFNSMNFLVDVDSSKISVTKLSDGPNGTSSVAVYKYQIPEDGNVAPELANVKARILKEFARSQ